MAKRKGVSTVVVVDGDKFLILKRSKTSRGAGFWNFPGGSIEKGEESPVAGVRELKEEAGLDVDPEDLEYMGTLTTKTLEIDFYITREYIGSVEINPESDDFEWITLDELDNYLFVGGGRLAPELIKEMEQFIGE